MNKKFITTIIFLLCLSLIGALVMQALWINNAWQSKRESFNHDVQDALTRVADRLETREAASFLNQKFLFHSQPKVFINNSNGTDSGWYSASFSQSQIEVKRSGIHDWFDTLHKQPETFLVTDEEGVEGRDIDTEEVTITEFSVNTNNRKPDHHKIEAKSMQLNSVLNQMVMEWSRVNVPIEKRVDIVTVHKMISDELAKRGINIPFQFGVMCGDNKQICTVKSSEFCTDMVPTAYSASLFPSDITFRSDRLLVFFDDIRPYFIRSLWGMLVLSALLSLIFFGTFATAIYVILKQKNLSEIKNDFINNMTHEFKTPIATISLAVDSINNPKVIDNKDRIQYYTELISRENDRMNTHVEHILQMALLDKENFQLNEELLNVHDIITRVSEPILMQVESRGGNIRLELNAENPYLLADEIHFTNVIYNLLDNANKYSSEKPDITVRTRNEKQGVMISVEDCGIGICSETQRRIFEKFYREQNGNIHNVKGFGLGLAYVKMIVNKHGGNVTVKSEAGKGSRFDMYLPFGHQVKRTA